MRKQNFLTRRGASYTEAKIKYGSGGGAMAELDLAQLKADKDRALTCLFIAVESSVAEDVRAKVNAYCETLVARCEAAEARLDDHHAHDRGRKARTPDESVRFINSDHPCCLPIGDVCQITVALRSLREAARRAHDWNSATMAEYDAKYPTVDRKDLDEKEEAMWGALAAALAGQEGA